MKNLIKFELRKILTKRFAVISIAAILLLSLILSFPRFTVCTHLTETVQRKLEKLR